MGDLQEPQFETTQPAEPQVRQLLPANMTKRMRNVLYIILGWAYVGKGSDVRWLAGQNCTFVIEGPCLLLFAEVLLDATRLSLELLSFG